MERGRNVVVLDRQRLRGEALAAALCAYGVDASHDASTDASAALLVVVADSLDLLNSLPEIRRPRVLLLGSSPPSRPAGTVDVLSTAPDFALVLRAVTDALEGKAPGAPAARSASPEEPGGLPGVERLSARELAVLRELARGSSNAEIGAGLGISAHTVRTHVQNIFGKLEVTNRHAAAALARRGGVLDDVASG